MRGGGMLKKERKWVYAEESQWSRLYNRAVRTIRQNVPYWTCVGLLIFGMTLVYSERLRVDASIQNTVVAIVSLKQQVEAERAWPNDVLRRMSESWTKNKPLYVPQGEEEKTEEMRTHVESYCHSKLRDLEDKLGELMAVMEQNRQGAHKADTIEFEDTEIEIRERHRVEEMQDQLLQTERDDKALEQELERKRIERLKLEQEAVKETEANLELMKKGRKAWVGTR